MQQGGVVFPGKLPFRLPKLHAAHMKQTRQLKPSGMDAPCCKKARTRPRKPPPPNWKRRKPPPRNGGTKSWPQRHLGEGDELNPFHFGNSHLLSNHPS